MTEIPQPWRGGAFLLVVLAIWMATTLPSGLDPSLFLSEADADPAFVAWLDGISSLTSPLRLVTSAGLLLASAALLAASASSAMGRFRPVWIAALAALAAEGLTIAAIAGLAVYAFASGGDAIPARHDPDVLALFAAIGALLGGRLLGGGPRGIALVVLIRTARKAEASVTTT